MVLVLLARKLCGSYLFGHMQEEGASNLAPDLQAQIDETLEEINPRYVLELLALPLDDEYRTRRREGLQGVRNILWAVGGGGATAIAGGFTREDFMNDAFLQMTAVEQVRNLTYFLESPTISAILAGAISSKWGWFEYCFRKWVESSSQCIFKA